MASVAVRVLRQISGFLPLLAALAAPFSPTGGGDAAPLVPPDPIADMLTPAHVVFDPPAWDFGDATEGAPPSEHGIVVRNDSNVATSELQFTVEGEGFAFGGSACPRRLEPGMTCRVSVRFVAHLPGRPDEGPAPPPGERRGRLMASSPEHRPIGEATLTGRAIPSGDWLVSAKGRVFAYGRAASYGDASGMEMQTPIVGMAVTPAGRGYWLVATDGRVLTFGDARDFGSAGGMPLISPIVGMAATRSGGGYWLAAADGGVFAFGDAPFLGSGARHPVVAIASTTTDRGYWLATENGAVHRFGDARWFGAADGEALPAPVRAMLGTASDRGYWLLISDGNVFNYGDACFCGFWDHQGDRRGKQDWTGMARSPDGESFSLVNADGRTLGVPGEVPYGEFRDLKRLDETGYDQLTDRIVDIEVIPVPPRQP